MQLYQLNRYLAEHHRDLWEKYGSGNRNLHRLAQFYRLRSLVMEGAAPEYEVSAAVIDRLRGLYWIHLSGFVGLCITIVAAVASTLN